MTRLNVRRAIAATSLSVLAVTGLAACGSDDDSSSNDDSSSSSNSSDDEGSGDEGSDDGTVEGSSFDVEEGEEVDPAEFASFYLDASTAGETAAIEQSTTIDGATTTMSGEQVLDLENPELRLTGDFGAGEGELVIIDGTMYLPIAEGGQQVSLPIDDPSNPLAQAFALLGSPDKNEQILAEASTSVTYTGVEEVDGVSTETYDVVLDPAVMFDILGYGDLSATGAVPEEITQSVAIDSEGRVVELAQLSPATEVAPETETVQSWSDFGRDVTIEVPTDAIPYEEFVSSMGGAATDS
ncbi:hypothetical protein QE364_001204 [Nocardioides zeae]|uniref:Uncharacterized protein n=1 Tax=Nocardioides zeae TaxID=1457234 RepID=A0ACC6IFM8_9ACTN|nr:hypothetical protein [Nocardioides zeae]MDR6176492.1 hypothetical protein [Nocardioides zeae]MDR6209504.1 hypothetical protein [Nocardioides zeae]